MMINCKNRKKPISISLILCLFLLCLLSGCGLRKAANEPNGNHITSTPEPTNAVEISDGTEEADSNKNEAAIAPPDASIATEAPKIEDFSKMDEYFKDYTFEVSYDEKLEAYQRTYSIYGTYDLNGDGKEDRINAELIANYEDGAYIEVNGIYRGMGWRQAIISLVGGD